jgi:hypothetical protein
MGADIAKGTQDSKHLFAYCISFAHFFWHNSFKKHAQVPAINTTVSGTDARKAEASLLKPLVPQGESIMIPVEKLDHGAAAVTEDEQRPRQRIDTQLRANQTAEAVEGFPHVTRGAVEIICGLRRSGQAWPSLLAAKGVDDRPQGRRIEVPLHFDRDFRAKANADAALASRGVRHKLEKARGKVPLGLIVSKPVAPAVELMEVKSVPVAEGSCAQTALGLLCHKSLPGGSSLSSRHDGHSPFLASIRNEYPKPKLREQPYQTLLTPRKVGWSDAYFWEKVRRMVICPVSRFTASHLRALTSPGRQPYSAIKTKAGL